MITPELFPGDKWNNERTNERTNEQTDICQDLGISSHSRGARIIPFLTVLIPDDEEEFLQPFAAAVNHNVVNESKTLQIIHTLMGNFCHGDTTKENQPEEMGNDACMMISYDAKVSMILD